MTMTAEPTLFEGMEVPMILLDGDTARTRRGDPVESHRAADKSAPTITAVRAAVLTLVRQEGGLTGSQINDLYRRRQERRGWPLVAWDSPRKRAGELAVAGLLSAPSTARGTEREFTIPEGGDAA